MKQTFTFNQRGDCDNNKVMSIKAWRSLTGLGLKEAKDQVEAMLGGEKIDANILNKLSSREVDEQISLLRENGIITSDATYRVLLLAGLKQSVSVALSEGDYELASDIIEVLKKHDA